MLPLLRSKGRVLILDDDLAMQRLMKTLLHRSGYRVDVVSTGAQAITRIGEQNYDVLLLDVMTPTEGGMTVIRHLRDVSPELLTRAIFVTGSPDSILKSAPAEVAGVVRKPFQPKELIDAIERVIGR